ncbi:MAG: HlyD family efflux transporter periplasmic adaptor subunit [Planctomycetota bacterium]
MTKKIGIVVVVVVAIALVALTLMPKPVLVETGTVTRGTLRVTVDEEAKTRIIDRYVVTAPAAGTLRRIDVREGDVVTRETRVAEIAPGAPALLDQRALAQARATVDARAAAVASAESAIQRVGAAQELAQAQLDRAQRLRKATPPGISIDELDTTRLNEKQRTAEARSAEFALQVAQHELEQAQAVINWAERGTSDGTGPEYNGKAAIDVLAPAAGRVLRVHRRSAGVVQAGEALLEVGDPRTLEVVADLLSRDAVRVRTGADVKIERWGGPRALTGKVRVVEPSGFTKVSALGVEEQRVYVVIDVIDLPSDVTLGDGYRVEARIEVWEGDDVVKVPASALFRVDGGWGLFRVRDGSAERVLVEIGHQNSTEAEVLSGLAADDTVILYPGDQIDDGVAVKVAD